MLETELLRLKSKRWDDFKERRLDAYKDYIAVVKKIKCIKTYILLIQIGHIMKHAKTIFQKKIIQKKSALARGFISIKLLLVTLR